jgi:hypothetical protein
MRDNLIQFAYALIFTCVMFAPMVAYFIIYGG